MNKYTFYKKIPVLLFVLATGICCSLLATSFSPPIHSFSKTGTLKLKFINTANGKPIVLRDSLYSNYFGEQYSISKLKYYISNITVTSGNNHNNMGGYFLMNEATADNSLEISIPAGNYEGLEFLLGVDSLRNCSGAQTGALDPMNDMFWTWNSGYVMFKMEGSSPASTSDLQRIEHHVGGYKGTNNVATKINFSFNPSGLLEIKANTTTEVVIETNLDNYWHGNSAIKIAEIPVCTTTGVLAKKIAANFSHLFSIKDIHIIP